MTSARATFRAVVGLVLLATFVRCRGGDKAPASRPVPRTNVPSPMARVTGGVLPPHTLVDQGAEQRLEFQVPAYASAVSLQGTYQVGPAPRARIDLSVLNADGGVLYEKRDSAGDSLRLALRPGRYTVVISNTTPGDITNSYGPPWYRGVRTDLELSYDRSR